MITPPNRIPKMLDKVKTDKRDAASLAQYYSAGLLKRVYVPPLWAESDRQILRQRESYQRKMRRIKSEIKSFMNLHGQHWNREHGSSWSKRHIAWLEEICFSQEGLRFVLDDYLKEYYFLRERVICLTRRLVSMSRSSTYRDSYGRLTSCKGVGIATKK